jgi:2-isopropylmalate synthase
VREVVTYFGGDAESGGVGIAVHLHDDAGTGVANALAGVRGGAIQVQGTINGYGERVGNCNLTTIIPNLTLKMGIETIPADRLERLTPVAHHVAELVNMALNPQAPYVGSSAFAHKAGLHTSAIAKSPDAYEHVTPDSVGNGTRFVVSELAGKSTLKLKASELGLSLDGPQLNELVDTLKRMEHDGYHFEVADASLELLMRRAGGWEQDWFEVESFRVITDDDDPLSAPGGVTTEATIKVHVGGQRVIATAEGNGPVNALDTAVRSALGDRYPALAAVHLTDYKVRVLDTAKGTGAVTRVLVDSTNGERTWTTIGVSENIIEASWQALYDSLVYGLLVDDGGQ